MSDHADNKNEVGKTYVRPWGTYQTLALTDTYQVKIITVNPAERISLQKHAKRAEHWVIIEGEPTITVGDTTKNFHTNQSVFIPKEAVHRIENNTNQPTKIIEVQIGDYFGEDDIVRIEDIYGRG